MSYLNIHNVTKSFQNIEAIRNLSLHVNKGEFVSIIGPSGSGKSTLFHLVGGMFSPEQGSIYLDNENITGSKGYISYMPQQASLLPWRNVLSNVLLGQQLNGQKKDIEKARHMLRRAGLADYEQAFPHELSGGMKQRVAFVRALISPQKFLCLDEPFSALDEFTRIDMQKWLLDMWEEERPSVLFITHNIDEALFLSDRILMFSARPATVIEEFPVPFSRPRQEELLLEEGFLRKKREIVMKIRGELNAQNH